MTSSPNLCSKSSIHFSQVGHNRRYHRYQRQEPFRTGTYHELLDKPAVSARSITNKPYYNSLATDSQYAMWPLNYLNIKIGDIFALNFYPCEVESLIKLYRLIMTNTGQSASVNHSIFYMLSYEHTPCQFTKALEPATREMISKGSMTCHHS